VFLAVYGSTCYMASFIVCGIVLSTLGVPNLRSIRMIWVASVFESLEEQGVFQQALAWFQEQGVQTPRLGHILHLLKASFLGFLLMVS
jgi:hypothetical protein